MTTYGTYSDPNPPYYNTTLNKYRKFKYDHDHSYKECLKIVSYYGLAIKHIPKKFKTVELVNIAILNNPFAIKYTSLLWRNNRDLMIELITYNFHIFQFASDELRSDPKFFLDVSQSYIKSHPHSLIHIEMLDYIPEDTRNDYEYFRFLANNEFFRKFNYYGVHSQDYFISYASDKIRSNRDFILEMLSINPSYVRGFNPSVFEDIDFIHKLIKINYKVYPELFIPCYEINSNEYFLKVIEMDHRCIEFINRVDYTLHKDAYFLCEAMNRNLTCINYLDVLNKNVKDRSNNLLSSGPFYQGAFALLNSSNTQRFYENNQFVLNGDFGGFLDIFNQIDNNKKYSLIFTELGGDTFTLDNWLDVNCFAQELIKQNKKLLDVQHQPEFISTPFLSRSDYLEWINNGMNNKVTPMFKVVINVILDNGNECMVTVEPGDKISFEINNEEIPIRDVPQKLLEYEEGNKKQNWNLSCKCSCGAAKALMLGNRVTMENQDTIEATIVWL